MVDSYLFLIGSQLTIMSTGKAKEVLGAVMKAVERDGECVFKLNEVDVLIQKESVVDAKEAKLEEIIMKINKINKNMNDKRYKTVSHLNVFMKKMKEVTVEIDAFNDEYVNIVLVALKITMTKMVNVYLVQRLFHHVKIVVFVKIVNI